MKYSMDQLRLLIAKKFIYWAIKIAPLDHPDSMAIFEMSLHVFNREPTGRK